MWVFTILTDVLKGGAFIIKKIIPGLTFTRYFCNKLARYLVIYVDLTKNSMEMKKKYFLLVVITIGLALIPFIKNSIIKHDEFDATRDLFI